MIKRTSKTHINKIISSKDSWKILDIGCGFNANKFATVICDVQDLSKHYQNKNFVRLLDKKLPFADKEFDFVIASHVMEHVEDLELFISELERISTKGYIELPTKLEDNLVFENKNDHIWQMDFDDVENKLLINKRIQIFEPILTVFSSKNLHKFFSKSLILELMWENNIEYEFIDIDPNRYKKISLLTFIRKYFSKKLRTIIRKN